MEKRQHDRYPAGIPCRIWWDKDGLPQRGRIADMSAGGAMVESPEPPEADTFVVELEVYGLRQRFPMERIVDFVAGDAFLVRGKFVALSFGQEAMLLTILQDLQDEQESALNRLLRKLRVA